MGTIRRLVVLVSLLLLVSPVPAPAGDGRFELREWGARIGGGIDPTDDVQYYGFHPYAGLALWEPIDRWLTTYRIHGLWIIEPWAAFVADHTGTDQTESFEIGVSPLFFRFTFGDWRLRPLLEFGEGVVYTDLRQHDLGSRGQFTSQLGVGIEFDLGSGRALTMAARYRHMSNASLALPNAGTGTYYGLVGLSFR